MTDAETVACIVAGMESYFRSFGLAEGMDVHTGDVAWVGPTPGRTGPAVVYRVSLDEQNADARVAELVPGMENGEVPTLWVISPTSTPTSIVGHLLSSGFSDLSAGAHPEPGMALDLGELTTTFSMNPTITLRTVTTSEDYALWIRVVNEALHEGDLLTPEAYAAWLHLGTYTFYLGYREGDAAATLATLRYGDAASLEFVSTLAAYRRQGLAAALCLQAARDLQSDGVKVVTLRSSANAIPLYTRLGFRPYYEQILMSYPRQEDVSTLSRSNQ